MQTQANVVPAKTIHDFVQFDNPTAEQVAVLTALQGFVSSDNAEDFMVVCGSAGTGKSSIMNAVVKYVEQQQIRVQIAAPTARAARIIAAKASNTATTLHSLLFTVTSQADKAAIHFTPKKDKIEEYTIFIVDEASMVNSKVVSNHEDELFQCNVAILNTIKGFIKSGNAKNKVIFVGDRYQLAPIGEKDSNALYPKYLQDNFKWQGREFHLTEVKRQDNGSYILSTATELRNSMMDKQPLPAIKAPSLANVYSAVPKYINELHQFGPDKVVSIAATHKQTKYFNQRVRLSRFGQSAEKLMKNDVLIVKRNWKRGGLNLYNGDMVIVQEVVYAAKERVGDLVFVPAKLRVKNNSNEEIIIEDYLLMDTIELGMGSLGMIKENNLYAERHKKNKKYRETKNIEDDRYLGAIRATYGYCITCNAAQGGEWHTVYMNNYFIPDTRWAYTAVTRAKEELYLF
jgi:exodeoxyribonuclease V